VLWDVRLALSCFAALSTVPTARLFCASAHAEQQNTQRDGRLAPQNAQDPAPPILLGICFVPSTIRGITGTLLCLNVRVMVWAVRLAPKNRLSPPVRAVSISVFPRRTWPGSLAEFIGSQPASTNSWM
jgi:hypothetical protein